MPTSGGVAHHVYCIKTVKGDFYLKIRGESFPNIPEIRINPADITNEYKALTLFGTTMSDNFPQIIFFDPERTFIILTDAMYDGKSLEVLFHEKKATPKVLINLGITLRKIHGFSISISESIRDDNDAEFFAIKLQHRFGYRNNPILDRVVNELTYHQPRQIILGDPSPKNIGVNNDGKRLIFFDLEDVHNGVLVFDVGFVIGHIILHNCNSPHHAIVHLNGFIEGYQVFQHLNNHLTKAIALGTILYRLESVIPYPVGISDEEKSTLLGKVEGALDALDLASTTWQDVIQYALDNR